VGGTVAAVTGACRHPPHAAALLDERRIRQPAALASRSWRHRRGGRRLGGDSRGRKLTLLARNSCSWPGGDTGGTPSPTATQRPGGCGSHASRRLILRAPCRLNTSRLRPSTTTPLALSRAAGASSPPRTGGASSVAATRRDGGRGGGAVNGARLSSRGKKAGC